MADKPSAAWYLAPIFLGIIGSAIMWFVLKDEDHADSPKMIKKGWIIGIILTVISFAWIPMMLIPFAFMGMGQQPMQEHVEIRQIPQVPESVPQLIPDLTQSSDCSGIARCFTGMVTDVIDGDTIRVGAQSIRFTLASTPEPHEFGGMDAKKFVEGICPVGSEALVDEDDGQTEGSYGRIVGVIYCNGVNLNEAVIEGGHGYLASGFCDRSEFATHPWAQKYGCASMVPEVTKIPEVTQPEENCDSSYPDVCIPPYPPDLDCGEIQYANFKVLPPDPHRFDGDKDGIGCES